MNKKQKKMLYRIITSIVLMLILKLINITDPVISFVSYMVPYYIIGNDILLKAFKGIKNKQVFDENFLMAIATAGAILLGDYVEGVAVMLFYQIGEFFQSYAVRQSRKNISELMDIRPDYANILTEGKNSEKVNPGKVKIGQLIIVNVGEKIPLDGTVVEGHSSLNTSALTGESKPKDVKEDDEVISGCINMESPLIIRVDKEFKESTVSRILDLVENATSRKSKSEDFISKFARYYTPVVCYLALALAFLPPLFITVFLKGQADFADWILRALTFLVISCPCALVISIPLSFFAGIGGASNAGILVKGSNYLERLSKAKYIAFDKTGTMTKGIFEVTSIHNNLMSEEELMYYAAHAEAFTSHPIGRSIIKEYGKELDKTIIESIKEISGQGIVALINGRNVIVGNEKIMNENSISIIPCDDKGTIIHIAIDNEYRGHIHIGDIVKTNSKKTITELKKLGIKKTVMLTGDSKQVGEEVGKELEIDETYCELLPQDKVEKVELLLKEKNSNEDLIFVGDGINDAPVLSLSDIGIAMGALGSDAAIEAADIVLMDDDPFKIVKAIKISRKTMTIVYENIYFAIGVKVICLILGALGYAGMWLAIFADVGVMVIAVLNAIRALAVKRL